MGKCPLVLIEWEDSPYLLIPMIFAQDIETLPPMELHEKLLEESIFFSQLEEIAAALPGANRLIT